MRTGPMVEVLERSGKDHAPEGADRQGDRCRSLYCCRRWLPSRPPPRGARSWRQGRSRPSSDRRTRAGAREREPREAHRLEPAQAGGEGYVSSAYGEHPPREDGEEPVAPQPPLGEGEVRAGDADTPSGPEKKRLPEAGGKNVGHERTNEVPGRSGQDGARQAQVTNGGEGTGEGHDDFAREGDAAALGRLQDENAEQPVGFDGGDESVAHEPSARPSSPPSTDSPAPPARRAALPPSSWFRPERPPGTGLRGSFAGRANSRTATRAAPE